LVRDAQASKSKTQILADRAAGWLFYVALGSALITAIVWISIGGQTPDFILERVVTVLVIACPHALGLAIPLVSAISVSQAAKSGLLIRSRLAFETAQNVDVVLFDKTGTLTTAERGFLDAKLAHSSSLSSVAELLSLAAGVERESEHPIGRAILAEAVRRNLEIPQVLDVRTIPGQGVTGILEATNLIVGGPIVLTGRNINIDVHDLVLADTANRSGNSVVYVVRESELLGLIEVGDSIRPTSKQAVFELQLQRKRVAILTGDAKGVAESVAAKLGITEIFAEVLPHQKAEIVSRLQADGSIVAMVGDGINDAPALAQADVGLAIGTGTSVAIESAGILLVSNDPMSVSKAITLSKRSVAKMTQNLWWAAGYNLIAIPLAAGVFLPLGLVLSPAVGAILMSLSTIAVAANAQLLRK
jgi:Cu2+-exporting ATPase